MNKQTITLDLPYPSLASLRTEHEKLMEQRQEEGETTESLQRTAAFISNGRKAGAVIETSKNRHAAQSMLDYWDNLLNRAGFPHDDPTLVPFDPTIFPPLDDDACPYLGLDAFREEDNYHFFGRQLLIQQMLEHLESNGLLVALGPSGSGKSSVVLAGLLPALKSGGIGGSGRAVYLTPLVPGSTPFENLAKTLRPANASAHWVNQQVALFKRDRYHLLKLVEQYARRQGKVGETAVLVIDQFEELFTLCDDRETRQQFVDNLEALFLEETAQHLLILTMRSDFETHVTDLDEFYAHFQNAIINVPPLQLSELRDAIEKPAERVGLKFQDGVVEALLKDILGEPAALPLLQFTLLKLWEKRERRYVTWQAYKELSGGRWALANSATQFYNSLIPEDQQTVKHILLQMVVPGEGFEVTSSRIRRAELYESGEDPSRIERVLKRLIDAKLVRVSDGDSEEDQQVEIAHEALVRNWPLLVEWLEDVRAEKRRRLRLRATAEAWRTSDYDESALLRGMMLEEAARFTDLNELEEQFVNESRLVERQLQDEKQAQKQKELEQAREIAQQERKLAEEQRARADEQVAAAGRLRLLLYFMGFLFVIVALLALYANNTATRASLSAWEAATQEAAAVSAAGTAQAASTSAAKNEAEALSQKSAAELFAVEAEVARDAEATSAAIAIDAKATAEAFATVAGEARDEADNNAATAEALRGQAESKTIEIASISVASEAEEQPTDLRLLLSLEAVNIPMSKEEPIPPIVEEALYSALQEFQLIDELVGHADAVIDVAYTQDGRFIATASEDGTVKIWNADSGQETLAIDPQGQVQITSLSFSPTSPYLAVGTRAGFVFFYDYTTGTQLSTTNNELGAVHAVTFAPSGERVVITHGNEARGSFRVWDVSLISNIRSLYIDSAHHEGAVLDAAFSADGSQFATSDINGLIQLFNTEDFVKLGTIQDRTGSSVNAIAFHPNNNNIIAAANQDRTVRIWNVALGQSLAEWVGHSRSVNAIVFNTDGSRLVSVSNDSTAKMWNVERGQAEYTLVGHRGGLTAVAFAPDSERFVTASDDATAKIWNIEPGITPLILTSHAGTIRDVASSPNAEWMLTVGEDRFVRLWDMENGRLIDANNIHNNRINVISFHPNQPRFITAGDEGIVYTWEFNSENKFEFSQSFDHFADPIIDAHFHPIQPWFISTNLDGTVRIWHLEDASTPLFSFGGGEEQVVRTAIFNQTGTQIATGDATGQIVVWEIEQSEDGVSVGNPTPINIHSAAINDLHFSADGSRLYSASDDKTVKRYNLESGEEELSYSGHTGPVLQLALNEANNRLATASSDGTSKLWDIDLGQTVRTFLGHTAAVNGVAFSADGTKLVTVSSDQTAQVFALEPIDVLFERGVALAKRPLTQLECNQYLPEGFDCFTQSLGDPNG